MDRNTRVRRAVIVCEHFTRNLAYYRAGWSDGKFIKDSECWKAANSNFLDICILEWCKLFGEKKGLHGWRKIYPDNKAFKQEMFASLKINQTTIDQVDGSIRHYRNKFVAHLDSDTIMKIPKLDLAKSTVEFYHAKLVQECEGTQILQGRITDLKPYYEKSFKEAELFYS